MEIIHRDETEKLKNIHRVAVFMVACETAHSLSTSRPKRFVQRLHTYVLSEYIPALNHSLEVDIGCSSLDESHSSTKQYMYSAINFHDRGLIKLTCITSGSS